MLDRREYELGCDAHGNRLVLFHERDRWVLIRDSADEVRRIELTNEQVAMIGRCARDAGHEEVAA